MNYFKKNISYLNRLRGFSPEQLAETVGLRPQDLADLETGFQDPKLDDLVRIAEAFEVSLDRLVTVDLHAQAERFQSMDIKLLVLDVDGVLTDGGMYFTEKGDEIKRYNTKDGRALMACKRNGIEVAFLSGGVKTKVIADRAERLGVERFYVGLEPKLGILDGWRKEIGLEWEQIAYIGDDMNDKQVMEAVGLSACPKDAAPAICQLAGWTLSRKGGDACVREFIETFLVPVDR